VIIIVLGATGMIGSAMLRQLSLRKDWQVIGIARNTQKAKRLGVSLFKVCRYGYDLNNQEHLGRLISELRPNVIVNCAGLTKHLPGGNEPLSAIKMNALLPHRLAQLCNLFEVKLIHVSTDCVFSGNRGKYLESDIPHPVDVYGKSKCLGEVQGRYSLTLRTSTIGHELGTSFGLIEWLLSQRECTGYRRAFFSGISSDEFAKVVRDYVLVRPSMNGLYHVGGESIDKNSLLNLIAKIYGLNVKITPTDDIRIDRTLNVERFRAVTGYVAPAWPLLIESMYHNHLSERIENV